MKRVLITGMSGTGKSTVIEALAARGYKAIDTDSDEWCEWVHVDGEEPDWIWREDRIQRLLANEDAEVLFLSGCKSNQGRFYPQLDHVILLSAPWEMMAERLATRSNNPYGKQPHEVEQVREHLRDVEPLLRRGATLEIDTRAPLQEVIDAILTHVCTP